MKCVTLLPSNSSYSPSIATNSSLLGELKEWNKEIVGELMEASNLLLEMLNNALDMAKLEEGKIEFDKKYESIRSIIDIILSISKANISKKNIEVITEYPKNLPQLLELDKSRITQVIMNILGNAIKFTPEKGKIRISVGWRFNKLNRLKSSTNNDIINTIKGPIVYENVILLSLS